jgi:hypothetical protein
MKNKIAGNKRLQAEKIWLENLGSITLTELSKETGLTRQTLAKYRKEDGWDRKLERTRAKVAEKFTDDASDRIFQVMEGLLRISLNKLFLKDGNGNPIRDENGRFLPNTGLKPTEIHQLMRSAEVYLKNSRLFQEQSAEDRPVNEGVSWEPNEGPAAGCSKHNCFVIMLHKLFHEDPNSEVGQWLLMQSVILTQKAVEVREEAERRMALSRSVNKGLVGNAFFPT